MKQCLNEKKIEFLQGNKQKVRELEKQFRSKAKTARLEYKDNIEEHFKSMNGRDAWKGLKVMMGRNTQQQRAKCPDNVKFVNEMNTFYARFDDNNFRNECDDLCQSLDPLPVTVFDDDVVSVLSHVVSVLSHVNPWKAPRTDGLKGKVLKVCTTQLGSVFKRLFQLLLDTQFALRLWRLSTITPVPKKRNTTLMKYFRPVALTSVLCKRMERIVYYQFTTAVGGRMDPL